jgi:hypothetical protein
VARQLLQRRSDLDQTGADGVRVVLGGKRAGLSGQSAQSVVRTRSARQHFRPEAQCIA